MTYAILLFPNLRWYPCIGDRIGSVTFYFKSFSICTTTPFLKVTINGTQDMPSVSLACLATYVASHVDAVARHGRESLHHRHHRLGILYTHYAPSCRRRISPRRHHHLPKTPRLQVPYLTKDNHSNPWRSTSVSAHFKRTISRLMESKREKKNTF